MNSSRVHLGIDIGSITVKLVVYDTSSRRLLWSGYRRHHARQQETALRLLADARTALDLPQELPVAVTGSGAQHAAETDGLPYIQEVNALVHAVRTLYPSVRSVVELGGEDAKMLSIDVMDNGDVNVIPVMNEKCAAGTGSMIDRMTARMGLSSGEAAAIPYTPAARQPIAAKCGVFAETDIVGMIKNGVDRKDLLCALFDAIVQQNLSTLARGRTPVPHVLLLGGPHCYYPGLVQCWQYRLAELWRQRALPVAEADPETVTVPALALFLPAIGAILAADTLPERRGRTYHPEDVVDRLRLRQQEKHRSALAFADAEERAAFTRTYTLPAFTPPAYAAGEVVRAHLGIDCGSTSIKAVLLDEQLRVVRKDFAFAGHDPIDDARRMLRRLRASVTAQGAELHILTCATTGYAKDILAAVLHADVAVVETVAHRESALQYIPDADVICDVGGQDIKVMLLRQGNVSDFRLNTQCSAGTGYFLQTVAERFDTSIYDFAGAALNAAFAPEFSAGCTIFLQSDIVNFMRAGYTPGEIMAGVTQVLPLNIWVYAARLYDLPSAGDVFVLQGGTQRNLAAVRAQVHYIHSAFADSDREPTVLLHPHAAEAGAVGCALLAARSSRETGRSGWIGFDALELLRYATEQSDATRCRGCGNSCARTIITLPDSSASDPAATDIPASGADASRGSRVIVAPCERGRADDARSMRRVHLRERELEDSAPDFTRIQEEAAFSPAFIAEQLQTMLGRPRIALPGIAQQDDVTVGMPRVLNFHSYAPLFTAWLLLMGVPADRIMFSPRTTRSMSSEGSARATIDPCFPAKICFAHVDALLRRLKAARRPGWLLFPSTLRLPGEMSDQVDSMACTVAAVIPEVVHAAYTLEGDEFERHGVRYMHPFLSLENRDTFSATMAKAFSPFLGASRRQYREAAALAWSYQEYFMESLRTRALETLMRLERERRLGIVLLGRPYHNDRGLHHGIPATLQAMGFPIFTADTLPRDPALLSRLFGADAPMSVRNVWPNPFSENSSRKMWAATFAARHPNLLAMELSNFKCGHDAPTYSLVRDIFESAGTPYFSFLDLDENTARNTLSIRTETIRHFLEDWCLSRGYVPPRGHGKEEKCLPQIA